MSYCRKGITFLLFCVVLTASNVFAEEKSVETTGYGQTPNSAIYDAIVQGVRQITGVSISSNEVMGTLSRRDSHSGSSGDSYQTQTTVEKRGNLNLSARGLVSRYDVTDINQLDDGSYQAAAVVYVLKYTQPGLPSDSRRTLAVMPLRSDSGYFNLLGDKVPATRVESELRNRLLDQFTQSRRVNVLDRAFEQEFKNERDLWTSGDAALAEGARVGNVLGADYIVVGNIRRIQSKQHNKHIQLTGETITSYSGFAQLDYKIILSATRQVKWSDSINLKFSDQAIRNMLASYGSSQSGMTEAMAQKLVQKALSNIYPMRVVSMKGKTIVINQGGKTLNKGDLLKVYFVGDEMFDPYTKESLGFMEEEIATIKVIKVNAKTTYCSVVEGEAELIDINAIVRR